MTMAIVTTAAVAVGLVSWLLISAYYDHCR